MKKSIKKDSYVEKKVYFSINKIDVPEGVVIVLAKDAIDAVRNAELEADRIEQSGREKAQALLEQAQMQAEQIRRDAAAADAALREAAMEKSRADAQALRDSVLQEVETEVASLRKRAEQKKEEAVHMILEAVIG